MGLGRSVVSGIGFVAMALFLSACGESFSAKYGGNVLLAPAECSGSRGEYYLEVNAQISSGGVEIAVERLVDRGTLVADPLVNRDLSGIVAGSKLDSNKRFAKHDISFDDAPGVYVSIEGSVSLARDEISNFVMSYVDENRGCQMGIQSIESLRIITQ